MSAVYGSSIREAMYKKEYTERRMLDPSSMSSVVPLSLTRIWSPLAVGWDIICTSQAAQLSALVLFMSMCQIFA